MSALAKGLATFATGVSLVALATLSPVAATPTNPSPIQLSVTCIITNPADNSYRAVFGYTNSQPDTIIAATSTLTPQTLDQKQTNTFNPGTTPAALTTDEVAASTPITWSITLADSAATSSASATSTSPQCSSVDLPAQGNGAGQLLFTLLLTPIALVISTLAIKKANHTKRRGFTLA